MWIKQLIAGTAIGLMALVSGCDSRHEQDVAPAPKCQKDYYREKITPECIIAAKGICNEDSPHNFVSIEACRGLTAHMYRGYLSNWSPENLNRKYGPRTKGNFIIEADTLLGENIWVIRDLPDNQRLFKIKDNPASVKIFNSYQRNWKDGCEVLKCWELVEKQKKLRQKEK